MRGEATESWMKAQLYPFHAYMVHAVRYAMDTAKQLESFQNLATEGQLDIRVGEYKDEQTSESVYLRSGYPRTSVSCKGWLESRLEQEYIYEHIRYVNLSEGNYEGINLSYTWFEVVKLTGSNLRGGLLLGTGFERCECDGVDFSGSRLFDADFRGCKLEQARFDGVIGSRDVLNEKHGMYFGIHGVRYQGANLTNASFRYARIAGDFTHAVLDGVDFTGADLTGSRMLERDVFLVPLTPAQRESVEWVEE
ncbi:pentapeptide repeat-containing protein [Paenibacillus plantiphilus]|nr:pentapeptide repeat-containing protein [Paenibacillus plantiphilus]